MKYIFIYPQPSAKHGTLPSLQVPFQPSVNISLFSLRDKPLFWILCYNPFVFPYSLKTITHVTILTQRAVKIFFFCFSTSCKWNHALCWLASCNINFEMIRVAAFTYSLFIFTAAKCSIVGIYHSLFIHSTLGRHLSSFLYIMNTPVHFSWYTDRRNSLR